MKIKFLCINLWQGGNLMDGILAFIKKENPDIIAMQEVYNGHDESWERKYCSMDVLKKELDYKFNHFAPAFLDNRDIGKIEQGNTIFSRFPIKSTQVIFYDRLYNDKYEEKFENFPNTPRNLQQVVLGVKGKEVNIFNTQGIWGTDGEDNERRSNMINIIIEQIKGKQNVILAGDFNLKDSTQAVANIEKYLINIFKGEAKTSFNMKRKIKSGVNFGFDRPEAVPGYAQAVVDMIFSSSNIKVIKHKYAEVDISDHLPLVTILEI